MRATSGNGEWQLSNANVFWGEIAPSDHVVQVYENDEVFLDLLEGFVVGGFKAGESVVIIATAAHLSALDDRLLFHNLDLEVLKLNHQYIALDVHQTLAKFMVNRWPDETLFNKAVGSILEKAKRNHTTVRAFGEMVAILWAQGYAGATVHLEHLWNKFCEKEAFCLFCAYPKSGFTDNTQNSMMHICGQHSKIIAGWGKPVDGIYYQQVEKKAS